MTKKSILDLTKVKYLVYGDYILAGDGDIHYVPPRQVARLFKVNPTQCKMVSHPENKFELMGYTKEFLDKLIVLKPKNNGNYDLQLELERQGK